MRQIKQIHDLRNHISEMGKSSTSIIKSMSDTLNFLIGL